MVEKSGNKDVDSDVEEVPPTGESIDLCDDTNDDDICEAEHLRKLFIGGLAGQTNEETLRKVYRRWGTVVDTVVMRDPDTKRSRGFGFVTYSKVAMVNKAQANRPHMVDGKTVESKRALPRPESHPTEAKKNPSVKKLFVGGIKDNLDEKCLNEYFSEYGNVVSVTLLLDSITGKRRGFALVEYDDYDAVDKAILQKTHVVNNISLDVKKSIYTKEKPKKIVDRRTERSDFASKSGGQYQNNNKNIQPGGPMGTRNMLPRGAPIQPQPSPYRGPQAQQQFPTVPSYQQGPPPNYNQWGPSPVHQVQPTPPYAQPPNSYPPQPPTPLPPLPQQQHQPMQSQNYGAYSQAPMPPVQPQAPQSGNWNNYHPASGGNSWNAPPPPPQPPMAVQPPAPNWQNNQWCPPPPSARPQRPMPAPNPAPPTNWRQPPVSQIAAPPQQQYPAPGVYQQPEQQHSVPPPPPLPQNFGNGYQQNYGGGPAKHSNIYENRMNPYTGPTNQYNNNPAAQGYGNSMPNGNRYRR